MNPALTHIRDIILSIKGEVQTEIIGQDILIDKLLITFFCGGHALIEGVPGLGKTKTIRTLAKALKLDTKRISFTPDLIPGDLTGVEIYKPQKGEFTIRKGPIFTNILLADEINRTPPKVQSALLEAMEEKRTTISETTFDLPYPFVVFATQNPLEHEGTYPLPEAQLDRFLMRIILDYPSQTDEKKIFMQESGLKNIDENGKMGVRGGSTVGTRTIIDKKDEQSEEEGVGLPLDAFDTFGHKSTENRLYEKINPTDLLEMVQYIEKNIRIDEKIYDYVCSILDTLRKLTESEKNHPNPLSQEGFQHSNIPTFQHSTPPLSYGPSTRAGLALIRSSRIQALIMGRDYVLPEDIKALAHDILDHRIGLSYGAVSEGITAYDITARVLDEVRIP